MRPLVLFLFLASISLGQQAIHGHIVAVTVSEHGEYITNPQGEHGVNVTVRRQVYRVETAERFYLLEGGRKREFDPGTEIDFRLDKGKAFLVIHGKEKKYRMVGEGLLQKP